jgi:NTE family protein
LQAGNVFQDEDDFSSSNMIAAGSIYVGFDTLVGPIWIGMGYAEGGNYSSYLQMGPQF